MPARRAFHPSLDFVVVRPFVHGEFAYAPQDPFPKVREIDAEGVATGGWTRAGEAIKAHIPERLFRQLWEQYKIDALDPVSAPQGEPVAAVEPVPGTEAPAGAETAPAANSEPPAGSATDSDPAHVLVITSEPGNDDLTHPLEGLADESAGNDVIATGSDAQPPSNDPPAAPTVEQAQPEVVPAKPYTSTHKGFGKYTVTDAAGAVVADDLTKDAAAELAAANQ